MREGWWGYMSWRDEFAALLDPRFYTLDWLDDEVWNGRALVWENGKGAIIATMREYPTGAKEVHGLAAAGDLDAIKTLVPLAEAYGRQAGAIMASISSRAAWSRALASSGYLPWQVEIRKELVGGS